MPPRSRARDLDPLIAKASKKFIDDENFVKSRAFTQFLWRRNMLFPSDDMCTFWTWDKHSTKYRSLL